MVHEDRVELRRGVIHILALGEVAMTGLRRRLGISDTAGGHEMLISILAEVADSRKGNYTLRERLWAEASDGYPAYSEIERSRMKANRKEALGANAEAKIRMQSLSEEQFDDEVNAFEKGYQRDVGVVTNDREESGMRKQFAQLYPLYTEVIARMEELQKSFVSLAGKFKAARTAQEKDSLAKRLQANHMKHKNRYLKYERVLPLLHRRMKGMHKALEGYLKEET